MLIALCPAALPLHAVAEEENVIYYIEPELPSDVEPYDPEHPEDLYEDQLYAKSAILIEASSGEAIFEKNADATMYPASTTKIMTVLLGIMILPTIIQVSESALRATPDSYYEGSRALGASHEKSVYRAVLPAAKSGVLAGVVLGVGRAIGETMAVIMVAGNQARMPRGLLAGVRTLTVNIVMEMGYAADLHRGALIATGVVLFVFILIINLCFSALKRRMS